jgi:anaerobic magnesium-protoporphyrin IX monomethyl ester cyclase
VNVLLCNPPGTAQGGTAEPGTGFSSAPLGLAYLASVLRQDGHSVSIADGYITGWSGIDSALASEPDLVGVTVYTPGRHQALEVCRRAKKSGAVTVMGGPHATIMWKQLLSTYKEVDLCVLGEGEQTIREIADGKPWSDIAGIAYRLGSEIIRTKRRQNIADLDEIPFPSWDCLTQPLNHYPGGGGIHDIRGHKVSLGQVRVPLVMSRGCTGHCLFCNTFAHWKGYRSRSGKNVADEIEMLVNRGYHHFVMEDDAMSLNRQTVMDFCQEVVKRDLDIAFFCTTRVDALDREMAEALKEAGAYGISLGVESGSQKMLDRINKGVTVEQNERALKVAKAAGLSVCALMMCGNPGETDETISASIDLLRRCDVDDVGTLGQVWLFPGTAMYQWAKRKGLIDDSYWLTSNETFTLYDGFTETQRARWHGHLCTKTPL